MNQFISETEIERRKHKRQEEWEKVRKADDPIGMDLAIFKYLYVELI